MKLLCFIGCIGLLAWPGFGQTSTDEGVFAALLRQPAQECAEKTPAGELLLTVTPRTVPMCVLQVFSEALMQRGIRITNARTATSEMTIDVREMNSSTVLCDNSSYLRRSSMRVGVVVRNIQSGAVAWSKEYAPAAMDTARGTLRETERNWLTEEKESWWETYLAPVLISAAALTIVVLLFTIRGS